MSLKVGGIGFGGVNLEPKHKFLVTLAISAAPLGVVDCDRHSCLLSAIWADDGGFGGDG